MTEAVGPVGGGGALRALRGLVSPPVVGGVTVDWDELYEGTGVRLPDDYREFVAAYGGGEFNSYMAVIIPPAEGYPYGGQWYGVPELIDLEAHVDVPVWLHGVKVLSYAGDADGDEVFWTCAAEDPNAWGTLVYKRQHKAREDPWKRFSMGMVDFWSALFRGEIESPFSSGSFPGGNPTYKNWRESDYL